MAGRREEVGGRTLSGLPGKDPRWPTTSPGAPPADESSGAQPASSVTSATAALVNPERAHRDHQEEPRPEGDAGADVDVGGHLTAPAGVPWPRCAVPHAPPTTGPEALRDAEPHACTPAHLAERILKDRGARSGERKQVTVLYADVSGFTSLSERLDPEEVRCRAALRPSRQG